jgi:hypothetical protein
MVENHCMVDLASLVHLPPALLETLPELPADLYPLRLTAFEKYCLWDETPKQPMNIFFELHFLDRLQVSVFEEALAAATVIHPMLVSTLQERGGDWYWQHQPQFRHKLFREIDHPILSDGRPRPLDLSTAPGIRFWYREQPNGHSRVAFQLHHAVADAVGCRRFIIDALTFYAHATNPGKVDSSLRLPWSRVDLNLLKRRDDFSDSFDQPPSQPLTLWQRLKNAHYFHFRLPQPLLSGTPLRQRTADIASQSDEKVENIEPLEHLVIDRQTSEDILDKARLNQLGINELALALLFETCSLWNQQHGDRSENSRLRVLMPYDLRSRVDLRMPATNRLSYSFLGRTQRECGDFSLLLSTISAEIQSLKSTQLPLDFLAGLEAAAKHPKVTRWILKRSRNMATAVLTYVGDVSRGMQKYFPEEAGSRLVGDARLEKILGAPPVRENTNWSLSLCLNWGQICIAAAWNRESLSRQQCQQLMQLYHSRWLNWLNS